MDEDARESWEDLVCKIKCSKCEKHLTEPKVLPCLHCYCKVCIEILAQEVGPGEPIVCTQCQYKTTLPSDGVNEIQSACFISRLQAGAERVQSKLNSAQDAKCELCIADTKAEKFCLQCEKFICEDCTNMHSRLRQHLDHRLSSLDDLKVNLAESLPVKESSAMCQIHNHPLNFYCYDCECSICRLCSLEKEKHEHHQYDKTCKITSKAKQKLANELTPIKELFLKIDTALMEVHTAKLDVAAREESNIEQLSACFDELYKLLQERKQVLIDRAKELAQTKIQKLSEQEKTLSRASSEITGIVEFTEQCITHSSDDEFMSMHDIIEKRINETMCEREEIKKALKPKPQEEVVVEVACNKDIQDLCNSLVFVTEQTCDDNPLQIVQDTTPTVKCSVCTELTHRYKAFCKNISGIVCRKAPCVGDNALYLDTSTVIKPPSVKCPDHNAPLKYYCEMCEKSICHQCRQAVKEEHKNHKLKDLEEAAQTARNKLQEINCTRDLQEECKESLNRISATKYKIKEQEQSAISVLRNSFRKLHRILSCTEQQYIEKVQIDTHGKLETLSNQEKELSQSDKKVQNYSNFIKECVDHLPDADIMKIHSLMAIKFKWEIQEHKGKLNDFSQPVERADIGVEVPSTESLRHLCETETSIITRIDPLKCYVDWDPTTLVSQPFNAVLITGIGKDQLIKRKGKIATEVELPSGIVTDCIVYEDKVPGVYGVQFTPTVRGCHWLTILVDEQHVVGSPFPIVATVSPASLKKPVKVWNDIVKPYGGTVSSKCDILCIENYKAIIQLTPDGHNNVIVHDCGLRKLFAIACDKEDNIYGIDELSNRMFTCDKNGGNTQLHEVELINGTGRGVLIILDNELITTDRGETQDTLCVYDREFNLINSTELTYKISDMCADSHGNIYTTDTDNCCIHIFDKHRVQLQTFSLDKKNIRFPWGISIFDQQVYLTDCANHSVVVFTTTASSTTSIGEEHEEQLWYPFKVFVVNGFVYVSDFFNHKILCF